EYHQLLTALDAEIARVAQLHAAAISCGPGCSSCCRPFSVLPIEAACLREAIASLDPANRERIDRTLAEDDDRCPLLIDDLCAIYAARPVICRTQGLPLAYVDAEREAIEVSACPLNFSGDYAFAPEGLLFMDGFNARLSDLNLAWCRTQGLNPDKRISLREIAACLTLPKT
ncbi:MAG: YkgJ family cysteine cluster protein, partial [Pseudomonadota bacterium]